MQPNATEFEGASVDEHDTAGQTTAHADQEFERFHSLKAANYPEQRGEDPDLVAGLAAFGHVRIKALVAWAGGMAWLDNAELSLQTHSRSPDQWGCSAYAS